MECSHLFEEKDSFANRMICAKARKLTRHRAFGKSGIDDIQQEFVIEIIKKYPSFDPGRGSEEAFIACVIKSKASSLLRYQHAQIRDFRRNGKSLNDDVSGKASDAVDLGAAVTSGSSKRHTGQAPRQQEDLAQLRIDVHEVFDLLPDNLRELAALIQEKSLNGASRELGKSRRQITNDVAKLRERFEDARVSSQPLAVAEIGDCVQLPHEQFRGCRDSERN